MLLQILSVFLSPIAKNMRQCLPDMMHLSSPHSPIKGIVNSLSPSNALDNLRKVSVRKVDICHPLHKCLFDRPEATVFPSMGFSASLYSQTSKTSSLPLYHLHSYKTVCISIFHNVNSIFPTKSHVTSGDVPSQAVFFLNSNVPFGKS